MPYVEASGLATHPLVHIKKIPYNKEQCSSGAIVENCYMQVENLISAHNKIKTHEITRVVKYLLLWETVAHGKNKHSTIVSTHRLMYLHKCFRATVISTECRASYFDTIWLQCLKCEHATQN